MIQKANIAEKKMNEIYGNFGEKAKQEVPKFEKLDLDKKDIKNYVKNANLIQLESFNKSNGRTKLRTYG